MNKNIEAINNKLDDIKSYRKDVIEKSKAEIRNTKAKIEHLESTITESDDIDDYKKTEQEIKDARVYLGFLESRQAKMSKSGLTDDEYNSMCGDIRDEADILQEKYAPEIQKKLFEAVALMDRYADEASELEEVINKAYFLREGILVNVGNGLPVRIACDIANCRNDKNNVWGRFVSVYYTYWNDRK